MHDYGHHIEEAPSALDGCRVLARMIDGLAFRFRWATDGLRAEDVAFRPDPDSMSSYELMEHVLHLVLMIRQTVENADTRERFVARDAGDGDELREAALVNLAAIRERLATLDDASLARHEVLRGDGRRFPVWNLLNGPLSDAFTHVGQLNAWRRLSGNPAARADVFAGRAPVG